jgi:ATP-dependent DNA helicase DinG
VEKHLGRDGALTSEVTSAKNAVTDRYRELFGLISRALEGDGARVEAEQVFDGPLGPEIQEALSTLVERSMALRGAIEAAPKAGEAGRRLMERIDTLLQETMTLVEREAADLVYVVERRGRGTFIHGYPIDVGPVFREVLYGVCRTQVFTSATLSTDGDFRFFASRMGLPKGTVTHQLEPVFDYMEQALLYVPEDLPDPSDRQFVEKIAPEIQRLVELCDGRAFLLFTSYRNMNEALRLLGPRLKQPVLVQGQASRGALLEQFREDPRSVLFATASFWEGVDVQGEALSLVVIDKLPFASPGDPLLKARLKHLEEGGGNAFSGYQVPAATITLKQGVGRLIRHRDDFGIIAILDGRLVRKPYGRRFLESLPRARRTQRFDVVSRWWRAKTAH